MTEETQNEPVERRILEATALLLGVAFWALLVWERFDPDGPHDFYDRINGWRHERLRNREAMRKTFEDIDRLPETEADA